MQEDAFRDYLATRLGARSIDSYISYCQRVSREVGIDLDGHDLSESSLASLVQQLEHLNVPPGTIRNCLSAVRAYSAFRGVQADRGQPDRTMHVTDEQRKAWAANTASSAFNSWVDGNVRDDAGVFDIDRLHDLAARYGINKRAEYAHLNVGQQRMNLGNILRRLVPPAEYMNAVAGVDPSTAGQRTQKVDSSDSAQPVPQGPKPALAPTLIRGMGVRDLLLLYSQIMDELRARQIVRTSNSPVGDYGELLFSRAFGWTLEGNSSAGYDATDALGVRYQIKARRLTATNGSRQLSAMRRMSDSSFDYLAAVLFDANFTVMKGILLPHAVVASRARRREHTNSWVFMLEDRVWHLPEARDVTAELARAQAESSLEEST